MMLVIMLVKVDCEFSSTSIYQTSIVGTEFMLAAGISLLASSCVWSFTLHVRINQ